MEENITPSSNAIPTNENYKPSDSAPTLGMNSDSVNTSKSSLPDSNSKPKHRKSHKDFPEIRAYYAK